jgi:hypothetical protein
MLHAHVRTLVRRNDWGEWAITPAGREALTESGAQLAGTQVRRGVPQGMSLRERLRVHGSAWRYGWRRSPVLAACAAAFAVAAGVAGGFVGVAGHSSSPLQYGRVGRLEDGRALQHAGGRPHGAYTVANRRRRLSRGLVRGTQRPLRAITPLVRRTRSRLLEAAVGTGRLGPAAIGQAASNRSGASGGPSLRYNCVRRASSAARRAALGRRALAGSRCSQSASGARGSTLAKASAGS